MEGELSDFAMLPLGRTGGNAKPPVRAAEIGRIEAEINNTNQTLDGYFHAFEQGTMPEAACGACIRELTTKLNGLQGRLPQDPPLSPHPRDPRHRPRPDPARLLFACGSTTVRISAPGHT